MSADTPLSYFYSRAAVADALGYEPSQALRASSPKVGALGSPRRLPLFAKASPLGRGVTVGDGEGEDAARMP